jgi:hypothetical protein
MTFFSVECVATSVVEIVVLFVLVVLSVTPSITASLARFCPHSLINITESIVGSCALVFVESSLHCVDLVSVLVEVAKVCHSQWSAVPLIPVWRVGARAMGTRGRWAQLSYGATVARLMAAFKPHDCVLQGRFVNNTMNFWIE